MLFAGYLDMVMWFCLARRGGLNADGTIFDRVQLAEQLATLWPQIKGLVQINEWHNREAHIDNTCTWESPSPLSPHKRLFHETLKNSQTGPVCMGSTCCVSAVQTWVWSWTASSNNQSLWHKQIKQRMYRSPGNVSKTPWYTHNAPGQYPWWFVLLWAKTVQTFARKQGNMMRTVSRNGCTLLCAACYSRCYHDPQIFLSAVFLPEGCAQRRCNGDDTGRCWDKQAVRRSRGNPVSHQCRRNFFEKRAYMKIRVGGLNP